MNGDTIRLEKVEQQLELLKAKMELADRLPQTTLGFQLSTEVHSLGHVPTAAAYHVATQSIDTSTWTTLTFATSRYDNDTLYDSTNKRFVFPVAGIYLVIAETAFAGNAVGHRLLRLRNQDGLILSKDRRVNLGAAVEVNLRCVWLTQKGHADWVEAQAWQDSGGALNVAACSGNNQYPANFQVVKVAEIGQL